MDISTANGLLRPIFVYLYWIFRFTGLLPFVFNFRSQRFETSAFALVYSIVSTTCFWLYHPISTVYYVAVIDQTEVSGNEMQTTHYFYNSLNVLMVCFCLMNIYHHRAVMRVLNLTLELWNVVIQYLPGDEVKTSDWLLFNVLQVIFIHFVYLVIFLNFRFTMSDTSALNMLIGLVAILPFGCWSLFLNTYPTVLSVFLLLYRRINLSIEKCIETPSVADLQLALSGHRQVSELLRLVVQTMPHFLAFMMAQMFCCTVFEVHYQYSHIVYALLFNHPLAPQIVGGGFFILPLFCGIFVMNVIACVKCAEESRKFLRFAGAVRSMEHYLTYLTHDPCKITVYEMFDVNFEIVFIFYATILSYVVILVQFNVADYVRSTSQNMTS